ncbi:MobF family relaxase [uncultured Serinicoccus sp.]|uniref:MobF family relaxase n=1 Tax=uncultured Serinicoccus sp. TaxID=735514 RepID=UPI00262FEAFD|nr:MobF family relaxase [uncultured Serinicoccus sp.]
MTIHKLTAGSGYDYLTRQVARQDATEAGRSGLASYYTEKGEAPGVWVGSGMGGIEGLEAGDVVTAEQMTRLFSTGEHPLGDAAGDLGRPYKVYGGRDDVGTFRIEVARRCESHNVALGLPREAPVDIETRARIRTEVGREMFREEYGRDPLHDRELAGLIARASRPRTTAVAGYDLTFSPVKSFSTLWALSDPATAARLERAHQDAVGEAVRFLESHALFTRTGKDGVQQVDVRGMVATAFTHRDSRAGDPDLHTHVAVANKVQTTDGRWLSIDGRVLFKATVTASETYNTALEKNLEALGLALQRRDPAPGEDVRKRPVREIVGVDPALNRAWSSRRASIQARRTELAQQFQADHGRPPNPVESIQLAQQATLETREAKHEPRSLAQQRAAWRAEAVTVLGGQDKVTAMLQAAQRGGQQVREASAPVTDQWRQQTVQRMLATVQGARSTWQVWHLRAEAQRRVRGTATPAGGVDTLVEELTRQALTASVPMRGGRADALDEPSVLRRADGTSVYQVAGSELFTSRAVLDAEARLVQAAGRTDGRVADAGAVDLALVESLANGVELNPGQATLVRSMATSGARLQLAIAPAGSGKTTAMRALTHAWEASGGSVVGLAPSAAAAAQLHQQAGATTDTLASLVWRLGHDPDSVQDLAWAAGIGPASLVIIDEAGMADTLSLDTAVSWLTARGASVRLVGDDQQLAAIGAGGVLRDIRATHGALHLSELMRFTDPAEGAASLALREGNTEALGFYLDRSRVHVGDLGTITEDVFESWRADRGNGLDSIMLAPTRELVSELNRRARAYRLEGADQTGREVHLADGNLASIGDVVLTRSNDRRLRLSPTDWVKNGDRWTVLDVHRDGRIRAEHLGSGRHITLPADYVTESTELGYASTVHTAQGVSVDTTHGVATGQESRQQLYTMLTRGRRANHVYLEVVGDGDPHTRIAPGTVHPRTATDVLQAVLARDDSPVSASTTLRHTDDPGPLLGQATARYVDALYTAAADLAGPERLATLDQVADQLVPDLTGSPAWPTLRAHLMLIAAHGHSPTQALHQAVSGREVDTAADPAAVLGWRLDDTGLRNAGPGPLPWVPGIPATLAGHPTWGPYLTARAARVTDLAGDVAETATTGPTPAWARPGHAAPTAELLGKVAVWRAATGVDDTDPRPTGPRQTDTAPATYQRQLRAELAHGEAPAIAEWAPLLTSISPAVTADPFAPVLAERLAAISRAGLDAATLTRDSAATGPLPDDHAASALWWRIQGHLSPAVAAHTAGDTTVTTGWSTTLLDHVNDPERAAALQGSPWWPTLVTTIDHALHRGWSLDALVQTLPAAGTDVDGAQAMVWKISVLADPPPADNTRHEPEDRAPEDAAWATQHEPDPISIQPTDAEWAASLVGHTPDLDDGPGNDLEPAPTAAEVEHALELAARIRRLGPDVPEYTEAQLDRDYARHQERQDSPVPVQRLADINQLALDYYQSHLAHGWAQNYLTGRFGQDLTGHPQIQPGFAPPGWTHLVDHLRSRGVTDLELETAGVTTRTRDGRLIDRFRDRVVLPIVHDGQVLGFVGRRNPHRNEDQAAGPKYLNTPNTPLFHKGDQLYGADPTLLASGATPVLVEGPMDAAAITLATGGHYVGVSTLGTALTDAQTTQLVGTGGPVIVARDGDVAGQVATERDHWLLAQHGTHTFHAALPAGTDPASLLTDHGTDSVHDALITARPLSTVLLEERLTHLPPDQALPATLTVLASADPATWASGIDRVAQVTGTDTDQVRRELLVAVRAWEDDAAGVAAAQLAGSADVRARLDAARQLEPAIRWAAATQDIDPRLPHEHDWAALARVMQHLHDHGHDPVTLARATTAEQPLAAVNPAQDLRYRLVVIGPPMPRPDITTPSSDAVGERMRRAARDIPRTSDRFERGSPSR